MYAGGISLEGRSAATHYRRLLQRVRSYTSSRRDLVGYVRREARLRLRCGTVFNRLSDNSPDGKTRPAWLYLLPDLTRFVTGNKHICRTYCILRLMTCRLLTIFYVLFRWISGNEKSFHYNRFISL